MEYVLDICMGVIQERSFRTEILGLILDLLFDEHRMPIPGLYQTGATTHPGGSVTGGPGRNAATIILKDFGTSIEEVVAKKA